MANNTCEFCAHEFTDEEAIWQKVDGTGGDEEAQMCPECGMATNRIRKGGGEIVGA